MLSGSLMPSRIARFVGSLTSSVEASGGGGGCVIGGRVEGAVERRAVRREHAAADVLQGVETHR